MNERAPTRRASPIACTLNASDLPARLAEWEAFGRSSVLARAAGTVSARFRLRPGDEALVAAATLAEHEQACCSFFEFSIALEEGERWLCVGVPEGAEATLAGFVELLSR